jgi:hypothetical protein
MVFHFQLGDFTVQDTDRGLSVMVYRPVDPFFANCIKRAIITSKFHTVLLLHEQGPVTIADLKVEYPDYQPVMKVVQVGDRVIAIPAEAKDRHGWSFSGNFLFSTDSRFTALNRGLPIPCHDMYE